MTPLPSILGGVDVVAWRLDPAIFGPTWDSGLGAFREGGRWNSAGRHVVYCSLDPATAIIEVAAHKGFKVLDVVPHVLTSLDISCAPPSLHVVNAADIPNPNWLRPGMPSAGQQEFGDALFKKYPMFVIPSVVSVHSWNLVFDVGTAKGLFKERTQERFALDTRLSPPP